MKFSPNYAIHEICGEHVAIFMGEGGSNQMLSLNHSAALLWKTFADKEFSPDDMVSILTSNYDIDAATARADVQEILDQWKQSGVIATD